MKTMTPQQATDDNKKVNGEKDIGAVEEDMEQVLLRDERSCIFETRVERASLCRDRGSAQFKAKDIVRAIEWYERALYHVDFDEGTWFFEFMDKHRDAVNEVRLPVRLNLAMCYLNDTSQDLDKVIEHANEALKIDATNAKALYRCGKAHLLKGDLDEARKQLKAAVQSQPNDKNIREALQLLAEKTAESKAKDKQTWGGRLLETTKPADSLDQREEEASKSTSEELEGGISIFSAWTTPLPVLVFAITMGVVLMYARSSALA